MREHKRVPRLTIDQHRVVSGASGHLDDTFVNGEASEGAVVACQFMRLHGEDGNPCMRAVVLDGVVAPVLAHDAGQRGGDSWQLGQWRVYGMMAHDTQASLTESHIAQMPIHALDGSLHHRRHRPDHHVHRRTERQTKQRRVLWPLLKRCGDDVDRAGLPRSRAELWRAAMDEARQAEHRMVAKLVSDAALEQGDDIANSIFREEAHRFGKDNSCRPHRTPPPFSLLQMSVPSLTEMARQSLDKAYELRGEAIRPPAMCRRLAWFPTPKDHHDGAMCHVPAKSRKAKRPRDLDDDGDWFMENVQCAYDPTPRAIESVLRGAEVEDPALTAVADAEVASLTQ